MVKFTTRCYCPAPMDVAPTRREELTRLWRLGAPVALTQLGAMALNVVDTLMVGELGVFEFDAAALGYIWIFGTSIFAIGFVLGADPIMTQAYGAGDDARLALAARRAVVVGLLASIPVGLSWLYVEPVLTWAEQDPLQAAATARYLEVQIWSLPFFLAFMALRQYLQAKGRMLPGLWVTLLANLFNIAANWALIWGHLGFEARGLEGAGMATALTRAILLIGLVVWVRLGDPHDPAFRLPLSAAAWDPKGLAEILRYGFPVALQYGLEGWIFQISGLMAGKLGEDQLAAHTAVLSMASTSFMLALGIAIGATTRVGNLIGMGKHAWAQRSSHLAIALGAGLMAACGLIFVLGRTWLPSLYIEDPVVVGLAATILPIAAAFQIADGAQVVSGAVLRGMGRTLPAAAFNFVAYYVLALPLAWLLAFELGWGLVGLWTALAVGLGLVSLMLVVWIRRRGPEWMARNAAPAALGATAEPSKTSP